MKTIIILIFASMVLAGCKAVKESKTDSPHEAISRVLIYGVIAEKLKGVSIKTRDNDLESEVWNFEDNHNSGCFAPSGDADKITDSTADISLNFGVFNDDYYAEFLYGKVLLHYKKDKDNPWKLESIDSTDLRIDKIPSDVKDEISKFREQKIKPLCGYYMSTPKR